MTTSLTEHVDTRDMIIVHTAFRREFRLAPGLVRATSVGDLSRAAIVAAHLELMTAVLQLHHIGEDRLLWPKLLDRASDQLAAVVTLAQTQHKQIHDLIASAEALGLRWKRRAAAAERDKLANVLDQLHVLLEEHLDAEEQHILPLAACWLSPTEWHQLGDEVMSELPRKKLALIFGMLMYQGNPEVISAILAHAPLLPRLLMPALGPQTYARYARRVHGTTKP
ncbi:MAG: hemerythrin domain-containing protein [Pseudonocardiales bacterium]|nr:hemerythrin domain-containing protein [Pseudonocardiales bacterium]